MPGDERNPPLPKTTRIFATVATALLVALAWHGALDRLVAEHSDTGMNRCITTYALARTLNGALSVAQGTEIAFQPVGVGVTLTAGEILDPLNDLVERFSTLVLVAVASIGVQMLLGELFGTAWVSVATTAAAACLLWHIWLSRLPRLLVGACVSVVFARFIFVLAGLAGMWIDNAVLHERQAQAFDELSAVSQSVAAAQAPDLPESADAPDGGLLDRFGRALGDAGRDFGWQQRLDELRTRAERGISAVINLIIVFVLQTIVIPIAAVWLSLIGLKAMLGTLIRD